MERAIKEITLQRGEINEHGGMKWDKSLVVRNMKDKRIKTKDKRPKIKRSEENGMRGILKEIENGSNNRLE